LNIRGGAIYSESIRNYVFAVGFAKLYFIIFIQGKNYFDSRLIKIAKRY